MFIFTKIDIIIVYLDYDNYQNMFSRNNTYTIPEVPSEFTGKEPTMSELYLFAQKHSNEFKHVQKYFYDITKTVWLCGQLQLAETDQLTVNLIQSAIDINIRKLTEYGEPCNSWEAAIIQTHERMFQIFLTTMEIYYSTLTAEYFQPNNDGYFKALLSWNSRTEN
jgi:hypothetical protein